MAGQETSGNSDMWAQLAALAYAYWQDKQKGSGSTPNYYNRPLTPQEQWWENERQRVYRSGGSDATKFVRGAGAQFLGSMPQGPTSHSFLSPYMQGQTFAGGITPPKIDVTKLPPLAEQSRYPTGNPAPGPTVPPGRGLPDQDERAQMMVYGGGGPRKGNIPTRTETDFGGEQNGGRFGETIADYYQRSNAGARETEQGFEDRARTASYENPAGPMGGGGSITPEIRERARAWWENYKQQHPDWARKGVSAAVTGLTAVLGPFGGLAGKLIGSFLLQDRTPPPGSGGVIPGSTQGSVNQFLPQNPPPTGGQ